MKQLINFLLLLGLATVSCAEPPDFHDQDLKKKDFTKYAGSLNGANFSSAILSWALFNAQSLKKANFKDADLDYTDFHGADLTEADLRGATGSMVFTQVILNKANLEGVKFNAGTGSSYGGANLKKCIFTGSLMNVDFSGADLRGANLRGAWLHPSNGPRWKGAIYDEDTAFPDGFDPAGMGMVLSKPEAKKE